ncbi:hypothetical protein F5890DRAFT_1506968, partial [Lentinula detonsa]
MYPCNFFFFFSFFFFTQTADAKSSTPGYTGVWYVDISLPLCNDTRKSKDKDPIPSHCDLLMMMIHWQQLGSIHKAYDFFNFLALCKHS